MASPSGDATQAVLDGERIRSVEPRVRARTSIFISLVLLLGGALELVKNSAIAYYYGSGAETDRFFAAYIIPNTYSMFWVSSCLTGLVPLFAVWLRDSREDFARTIGGVVAVSTTLMAALAGVAYLAAPLVIKLLAPGFSKVDRLQTVHLFRGLSPVFALVGFTGVAIAVLNCHGKFLFAASNKLFVNLFILVGLFIGLGPLGIHWLVNLIVIGTLSYAAFLLLELWRSVHPQWGRTLAPEQTKMVLAGLSMPFFALIFRQSSVLGERVIASFLPAGSISELSYSLQVVGGLTAIILTGVTMPQMPLFAHQNSNAGKLGLLWQGIYYLLVVTLPLACGGYLLARPLVVILFRHGVFSMAAADETARVFRAYAFGIVLSALAVQFQTPFWADRRYATVIRHNGLVAGVNILLDLLLAPFFGVVGIAWGCTLASAFSCLRMGWLVHKRYGSPLPQHGLRSALKPLVATLVMAAVVFEARAPISGLLLSRPNVFYQEVFRAATLIGLGALAYVVSGFVQRMEPFPTLYRGAVSKLFVGRRPRGE